MHEYSIIQSLVEQVEVQAASHRALEVKRLTVSIGEMSGVDVGLLQSAYDLFREKTICEHAELVIRNVAAAWRCQLCQREIERGHVLQCPGCGAPARLVTGDEIILERIELEGN